MRTKSYGQLEREIESLEDQVQFLQDELEAAMRLKDSAVAAEREACARTVERARLQLGGEHGLTNQTDHIASRIAEFLAAAVRARGDA